MKRHSGLIPLCLFVLSLPGVAMSASFDAQRVKTLDFESVPAAEVFSRIAAQTGIGVTLDGCPPANARVTANAVSGRLPVVLDRLTAALGCTWRERAGVVYVHGPAPAPFTVKEPAMPSAKPEDKVAETRVTAPATSAATAATMAAAQKPVEKAVAKEASSATVHPSITVRLGSTDIPTYALRDFLREQGMSLVWGAGDVASVTTVPGEYTGDTPLAAVDTLLRAHGLRGVYVRSNKTLYVR